MTTSESPPPAALPPLDDVCRRAAELLRTAGHPLRRLTVRAGDTVVELEWPAPSPAPRSEVSTPSPAPDAAPDSDPEPSQRVLHLVTAPHLGTFYRCPEPGAAPFVAEGDVVRRGQRIGILEAMKLMNPIEADHDGRVAEILVDDGTAVEFEQPLLALLVEDGV